MTSPSAGTQAPPVPQGDDALALAYRSELAANPSPPGGALLAQTVAVASLHRTLLAHLPQQAGWQVLDLGTGFGPLAFELAHRHRAVVTGVDLDADVLAVTRRLAGQLAGWMAPGSSVELVEAPAEDLPFAAHRFDLATAVLLLQHVPSPAAVVAELGRVVRPGGFAFVFDVDDGLGATYPDGGPLGRLEAAFDAWQASYGGDRRIGRKLSVLFGQAGFEIVQVTVLPEAQHLETRPGEGLRAMTATRLRAARPGIVGAGLLDGDSFDSLLAEYESGPPRSMCRIEGRVALLARKPGGAPPGPLGSR